MAWWPARVPRGLKLRMARLIALLLHHTFGQGVILYYIALQQRRFLWHLQGFLRSELLQRIVERETRFVKAILDGLETSSRIV